MSRPALGQANPSTKEPRSQSATPLCAIPNV
jgi:hypothetical protein